MVDLTPIINSELARYGGPVLIYDTSRIRANIVELTEAFGGDPTHVFFAVKSFPTPCIIRQAWEAGIGFEVSTEREYQLLPKDLSGRTVSLTGPLPQKPARFLALGNQLQVQLEVPGGRENRTGATHCHFGLRLDHKSMPVDASLLVEKDRPSRFGVSWEVFLDSAPLFRNGVLSGVHLHNGSEVNTAEFYRAALQMILWAEKNNGIRLRYANLGGGFHSIPQADLVQLLSDLRNDAGDLPIFIEPGHVLCRNAGFLLCRAQSVRPFGGERYHVTLDASYDCHAKWSRPSWAGPEDLQIVKMPYQTIPTPEPGFLFLVFTGATCYEKDQLGIFRVPQMASGPPVAPGDPILLSNINGYSFAWNTEFNGVPKATVRFV